MRPGSMHVILFAAALCLAGLALCLPALAHKTPDYAFDLDDMLSGENYTLDGITDGKPAVVLVWAVNCPHCMRHMPYVAALYKKLDTKKVNFVSISMGDKQDDAKKYAEEKELAFPVLDGSVGEISSCYEEEGWPATYVFFAGGKLKGLCVSTGAAYIRDVQELVDEAQ